MARDCENEHEEPSNGEREREREGPKNSARGRVIVRGCQRGRGWPEIATQSGR